MPEAGFMLGFSLMGSWGIALAVLVLLMVLYGVYRYAGKQKLARRLEQLRSVGYPVTFEELEQRRELPEGTPNAADLYLEAISYYQEATEDEIPNLPIIGDAECPEDGQPYPADQVEAAQAFLEKNRQSLDLLYQAASVEKTCFEMNCVKLMDVPPAMDIKDAAGLLALDSLVHLEHGDLERVIQANTAVLHLSKALIQNMVLIYGIMGGTIQGIGVAGFREGINRGLFSKQQLDRIAMILQDERNCYDLKALLAAEQCFTIQSTLHPGMSGYRNFQERLQCLGEKLVGLREINVMKMIDLYGQLNKVIDLPYHQQIEQKDEVLQAEYDRLPSLCYKAKQLIAIFMENEFSFGGELGSLSPMKISSLSILFECQAKLDAAIAACGVERYRLSHDGKLPQTLDALVPEYIAAVPYDPFDGEFLKYEILPDGYAVYTFRDQQWNKAKESPEKNKYSFKVICQPSGDEP